ncbi:regulatory protein GemA [Chelatococcus sp. XZ-Ab1]|uniref:regulatory protein GemA n=1 Tax=Chelatococcus sp. XZ-Ab1 TaxID=3034027 RepID=UPI0023E3B118|nr:regulatory protein GemA [Chelatococcus sp. XZ-Ab1]
MTKVAPSNERVTPAQICALQAARRKAGMTDEDYRAWLDSRAGVFSTTELSRTAAARLIDELNARAPRRSPAATVSGIYAGKLRALWISGWQLGVVAERDDRALLAFVQRQTGVTHTRFLTDPKEASKAIEALKAWLAREARVAWPGDRSDVIGAKRAVLRAQARLLAGCADLELPVVNVAAEQLDATIAEYGRLIRRRRGRK